MGRRHKLDEGMRALVVQRYMTGWRVKDLAVHYQVTTQTIRRTCRDAGIGRPSKSVTLPCQRCNTPTTRNQAKAGKVKRAFCSKACYFATLADGAAARKQGRGVAGGPDPPPK